MAIAEIPHMNVPADAMVSHAPNPVALVSVEPVSEFAFSDPRANLPQLELGPNMQRAAKAAEYAGKVVFEVAFLPFVFVGHVANTVFGAGSIKPRNSHL